MVSRKKMKMNMVADIPTDVLVDILSRLPAKCVWGLRSVCKDWKSLIEDPTFADLQLRQSKEEEVFMFWSENSYERGRTSFYSIDYKDGKAVKVVEDDFFHPSLTRTSSIDGLVCYHATDWEIKVSNPVTRETITLPKPSFLLSSNQSTTSGLDLGIGFDSSTKTYKVLANSYFVPPQIEIFTLRGTNSDGWRKLQLPSEDIKFNYEGGFYANGCAFWETWEDRNGDGNRVPTLMTFNFAQENFEMFPYPPDFTLHHTFINWTNQVRGSEFLIQAKRKMGMVKMWTLAPDSSGKQVWFNHHTLLPRFQRYRLQPAIFPIPNGVMLFKRAKRYKKAKLFKKRNKARRYICFYSEGQVVKSIRVHGIPRRFSPLQLHTQSLVSLKSILAAKL